jgi:hypothetical protein
MRISDLAMREKRQVTLDPLHNALASRAFAGGIGWRLVSRD